MKKFLLIIFINLFSIFWIPASAFSQNLYLFVDKGEKVLEIREGSKIIKKFKAGFGLKSPIPKYKKGDLLTPEGIYRILKIYPSRKFFYFLRLNYPNENDLAWAYYRGKLTRRTFKYYLKLLKKKKNIISSLGNGVGIHGGGAYKIFKNSKGFYKNYHWTKGCIALNNRDLLFLLRYAREGEKVFIVNSHKKLYEILKKFVYPLKIKPFDFFEGEVYFKEKTGVYWDFYLIEKWEGIKKLEISKWENTKLIGLWESDIEGNFEDKIIENMVKEMILKDPSRLIKPPEEPEI